MRIFLDTNVLASGLGTRGLCAELLEAILGNKPTANPLARGIDPVRQKHVSPRQASGYKRNHELVTSDAVLLELERTLSDKFHLPRSMIKGYVDLLRTHGQVMAPASTRIVLIKDSADAENVACAIAAKADVFVTGDKALLDFGSIENLPVLTPRELWLKLAGQGPP